MEPSQAPDSLLGDKPMPRTPRSKAKMAKIRAQNRRREYLQQHSSYFASVEHEFADPVLYQLLVRNFQTAAEREAEGKVKGYGRVLEGDLLRGEAKLEKLSRSSGTTAGNGTSNLTWFNQETDLPPPKSREEGRDRWVQFLTDRFIHGEDDDFDYSQVDGNEDYDAAIHREHQDTWFDDEEPGQADEGSGRPLEGETGIQDY